jgi:adenine deaminase
MFNTVRINGYRFPPVPKKGKARAMELVTRLVTRERIIDLEDPEDSNDVIMPSSSTGWEVERPLRSLKGFGLKEEPMGRRRADMPDMIVVG